MAHHLLTRRGECTSIAHVKAGLIRLIRIRLVRGRSWADYPIARPWRAADSLQVGTGVRMRSFQRGNDRFWNIDRKDLAVWKVAL